MKIIDNEATVSKDHHIQTDYHAPGKPIYLTKSSSVLHKYKKFPIWKSLCVDTDSPAFPNAGG